MPDRKRAVVVSGWDRYEATAENQSKYGDPIWFSFKGGGAVLVRSFHAGDRFFARNWHTSKCRAFLDWAGRQGYNMLSAAS
jgi:hypothetical protein